MNRKQPPTHTAKPFFLEIKGSALDTSQVGGSGNLTNWTHHPIPFTAYFDYAF